MEWEFTVLNNIQKIRTDFLDRLMPSISFLGKWAVLWLVIAIMCLAVKKYRKIGVSLAINIVIDTISCSLILKPIVQRLRPYTLNEYITLIVPPERDFYSFPSGHSLFAFGAATIIFIYNKKLGICMYLLAAMIAFSRLYLYVHFPTDVMTGAAVGILLAILSYKLQQMFFSETKLKHLA